MITETANQSGPDEAAVTPRDCEFCGSSHLVFAVIPRRVVTTGQYVNVISCVQCGAHGPEATSADEAIKGWNGDIISKPVVRHKIEDDDRMFSEY